MNIHRNIPVELRSLSQWVGWRYEERNGKRTKPPIDAKSNGKLAYAKSNNPATWTDFNTAVQAAAAHGLNGIGFCFAPDDGLTGLDLDHVLDPASGELKPEAAEILARFAGTYIEVSPSGTGLRLFCYGKSRRSGKNTGKVKWLEVYSHPSCRYLTVTGNRWNGNAANVTEQQAALDWLHGQWMQGESTESQPVDSKPVPAGALNLDDTALLDKARAARNGSEFAALWSGDLSAHGGDHSAADLALCNALAFWTGGDAQRIDRLFRQSGLMREKWDKPHFSDGRTYGQATVEKAIAGNRETYNAHERFINQPSQPSQSSQSISYDASSHHGAITKPSQAITDFSKLPVVDLTTERKRGRETVKEAVIDSIAAAALAGVLRDRLAFCREAKIWHCFNGTHWQPVDSAVPDELVTHMLYAGTAPCGFKANYGAAVVTLLRKGLLPLPETASKPSRLIPFQNGLLNPETRELTPIKPENALTWTLPYQFDAHADCPTIKAWLTRVVDGDAASIEFLRAWFAALLVGRPDLQKFLHLLGPGNSGKGTMIRLAQTLVGAHNTMPTDLRNLEQSRFETASLYGKRLVAITDTSRYGGSVDTLKALTGQDSIRLERKHKDPGSFTFDGMVIIASNEALQFTDYSGAVERRRLTVRLDRVATDDERALWDAQGGEAAVLHAEIPGLVNWCLALTRNQVTQLITKDRPERVNEANRDALLSTNPIARWLAENTISDADGTVQVGTKLASVRNGREFYEYTDQWLYPNYLTWCQCCGQNETEPLNRFSALVVSIAPQLGMTVKKLPQRRNGAFLKGLRLRPAQQPQFLWPCDGSVMAPCDGSVMAP